MVLYGLKLVVATALIWWILRRTNLGDVAAAAGSANIVLLAAALAARFFGIYISVTRWKLLLGSQGVRGSVGYLYPSFLVGMFFNNFLPSSIGGDTYRSYANWRLGATKTAAVVVTFAERFLGLVGLLFFALLALIFAGPIAEAFPIDRRWFAAGLGAAFLIGSLVWRCRAWAKQAATGLGLLMPPACRRLGTRLIEVLRRFRGRNHVLVKAYGVSLLVQVNSILAYYIIALALDIRIGLVDFFAIIPIATVVMVIPISINAIGVRENVFAFLMSFYGVTVPTAVAFAWLALGLEALQGLAGGVIYALRRESSSSAAAVTAVGEEAAEADLDTGRGAARSGRRPDLQPALTVGAPEGD